MGPPPSTSSPSNLRPHWPKPYCTGAPISISVHSSQIILYSFGNCTNPLFPSFYIDFCRHLWQPSSFLENATHVTLGWGIPYHLLLLTSPINPEYPTGPLPLLSEFVHFVPPLAQFFPCLVVPLTLDLLEQLLPLILHIYPQPREVSSLTAS
jgi:hypothetical protein